MIATNNGNKKIKKTIYLITLLLITLFSYGCNNTNKDLELSGYVDVPIYNIKWTKERVEKLKNKPDQTNFQYLKTNINSYSCPANAATNCRSELNEVKSQLSKIFDNIYSTNFDNNLNSIISYLDNRIIINEKLENNIGLTKVQTSILDNLLTSKENNINVTINNLDGLITQENVENLNKYISLICDSDDCFETNENLLNDIQSYKKQLLLLKEASEEFRYLIDVQTQDRTKNFPDELVLKIIFFVIAFLAFVCLIRTYYIDVKKSLEKDQTSINAEGNYGVELTDIQIDGILSKEESNSTTKSYSFKLLGNNLNLVDRVKFKSLDFSINKEMFDNYDSKSISFCHSINKSKSSDSLEVVLYSNNQEKAKKKFQIRINSDDLIISNPELNINGVNGKIKIQNIPKEYWIKMELEGLTKTPLVKANYDDQSFQYLESYLIEDQGNNILLINLHNSSLIQSIEIVPGDANLKSRKINTES